MPAAVKLSRIPYGFFEKEMWSYFSQFGRVEKLKLFRSKKTGNSKGFAFIQFTYESVAKIVAETMNNYLMFDKLLKCRFIPESKIQPSMFKNWRRVMIPRLGEEKHKRRVNANKDAGHIAKSRRRLYQKLVKKNTELQRLGVTYQFKIPPFPDGFCLKPPRPMKRDTKYENGEQAESALELTGTINDSVNSQPSPYTMLVDSSDDEIELKTPPQSIRKRKLSVNDGRRSKAGIKEMIVKTKRLSVEEEPLSKGVAVPRKTPGRKQRTRQ